MFVRPYNTGESLTCGCSFPLHNSAYSKPISSGVKIGFSTILLLRYAIAAASKCLESDAIVIRCKSRLNFSFFLPMNFRFSALLKLKLVLPCPPIMIHVKYLDPVRVIYLVNDLSLQPHTAWHKYHVITYVHLCIAMSVFARFARFFVVADAFDPGLVTLLANAPVLIPAFFACAPNAPLCLLVAF